MRLDIKRIRDLDPDNIDNSKSLIQGYRLIGDTATADVLQAKRVPVRTFTDVFQEWDKAHPFPAEKLRDEEMVQASAQWVKDWPNETNAWYWRMNAVARYKASTPAEIEKAGEDVLASNAKTLHGWTSMPYPYAVAQVWIEHDIRLKDCPGLLQQATAELDGTSPLRDDRIPATAPAASAHNVATIRLDMWRLESELHRKLLEYDQVRTVLAKMKTWIDAHPDDSAWPVMTWHEETALLADAEGHKPDALMNYQQGYQRKPSKVRAAALWAEMGGTTEGFELWWKRPDPPKTRPVAFAPTPWAPKDQSFAKLNARDLSGKTWTVADLKGKRTLINIWATWCEPCRQELPSLQRLYEQVKDRNDIQVVTINTDEDPGLLASFLKAEHYTFPILLAKTLADDIDADLGIPRNWIVDANGNLSQESIGFYAAEWPEKILAKLTAAK